jgi:hypothetical protein
VHGRRAYSRAAVPVRERAHTSCRQRHATGRNTAKTPRCACQAVPGMATRGPPAAVCILSAAAVGSARLSTPASQHKVFRTYKQWRWRAQAACEADEGDGRQVGGLRPSMPAVAQLLHPLHTLIFFTTAETPASSMQGCRTQQQPGSQRFVLRPTSLHLRRKFFLPSYSVAS